MLHSMAELPYTEAELYSDLMSLLTCRCDYLPLCSFVTLQPPAAVPEIMKRETHRASQWLRAQFSSMWTILPDRMETRQHVIIHTQHACSIITSIDIISSLLPANNFREMTAKLTAKELQTTL